MELGLSSGVWGRHSSPPDTPEQYASTVKLYSEQSKEACLHPGGRYQKLAELLNPLTGNSEARDRFTPGFKHVIIHELSKEKSTIEADDHKTGFEKLAQLPSPKPDSGLLVFLRGYSSGDLLCQLGSQYKLGPESLRRHFEFIQPDFYDLPTLPSSSRNIIELRLTTICTRKVPLTQAQIEEARREEVKVVNNHHKKLGSRFDFGESIIRKVSIHSEYTFTIEQKATICLKKTGGSWTAIILLDNGRYLTGEELCATKSPSTASRGPSPYFCYPIIQHRTSADLEPLPSMGSQHRTNADPEPLPSMGSEPVNLGSTSECRVERDLTQSACLLPSQYGCTLDESLAPINPLYTLSEIFNWAASSESQLLNLLKSLIDENIRFSLDKMEQQVANLKHSKILLEEHTQYLRGIVGVLRNPKILDCPGIKQSGKENTDSANRDGKAVIDATLQDVLIDYEDLLTRAESLAAQCLGGTNIIMSSAMLEETQKSITQAKVTTKLTYLAFFFLPLSLTASIFGMNIRELGTGVLDIWCMFTVLIPLVVLSVMLASWDSLARLWNKGSDSPE